MDKKSTFAAQSPISPAGDRPGQGTIEYLVIIAVIVVIGLVIVALISNLVGSPATTITDASNRLSQSSGGISIYDAVVDTNGKGLISLANNSGGVFTITKISLSGVDSNYGVGKTLTQGDKGLFSLENIGVSCNCAAGDEGKKKKCVLTVTGLSEYNIQKQYSIEVSVSCITDTKITDQTTVVQVVVPVDATPPVVYLLSPVTNLSSISKTVDFNFNATDASTISRCELFVNGVSDTNKTVGLVSGVNTITKTFLTDSIFDWNVSCYDSSNNRGDSNSTWHYTIDSTSPVVYLSSPVNGSSSVVRTVDFNFNLNDSSSVSRCELFVNGVSDTNKTIGLVNGINTITKTLPSDLLFDWNVNCYDSLGNKGDSNSTWKLEVNADPLQITNCTELQNISSNRSGSYTLMNDINCYGTNTWNGNAGFIPVSGVGPNGFYDGGGDDLPFTGSLNGGYYSIRGLVINRPASSFQALFGLNDGSASVSNVRLVDTNVWGNWFSAGLVGRNGGTSTITNCSFSGNVVGTVGGNGMIGGLFGGNWGTVSSSFSTGTVSGSNSVGGLGGIIGGIAPSTVIFCYSTSTVSGASSVGGLIGSHSGTSSATRLSYSTGNVTSTGANAGGVVGSNSSGNVLYDFTTSRITAGSVAGGLIGSHSPGTITLGRWYDVVGDSASTCYSGGGTGCVTITDAMGGVSAFYYDSNVPLSSWGTWNLVSGNKYSTGTWSICRGASYPWLTWENRTC